MISLRVLSGVIIGMAAAVSAACVSDRASGPTDSIAGCTAKLPSEAFGSTVVIIRNFAFSPATVTVPRGSKVTWVNCEAPGTEPHTSTGDAGAWDSKVLPSGATFTTALNAAGSYTYRCTIHPAMRATVTVQ